jgi:hypothetical protein
MTDMPALISSSKRKDEVLFLPDDKKSREHHLVLYKLGEPYCRASKENYVFEEQI